MELNSTAIHQFVIVEVCCLTFIGKGIIKRNWVNKARILVYRDNYYI